MSRGSGDIYRHVFDASQISNTGYFPQTDMYPMMHIWLSILHNFFPDFIILGLLLSIVFFILYVLYLYILGKTILGSVRGGIFVSIFGLPLIFSILHYAFVPFFFALLSVPLILYLYQKMINNFNQWSVFYICLIFLSLFIVFCHPMITVFIIIMFSIFAFYEFFKSAKTLSGRSKNVALNIMTIICLTFFLWLFQNIILTNSLKKIVSALLGYEGQTSIFENQAYILTSSNASIWLVIDRFVKTYGSVCLYFSISLLFLFYIIYQYFQNKKIYEYEFIYSIQNCVAICIGIALITGYFVIFEPIRAASYGLIFATIMCGLFFYRLWFSTISKKRKLGLITSISVIITVVCIIGIFTIYLSPWSVGYNTALTYEEKNGVDWILEYRNSEIPIVREEDSMDAYSTYYYESTTASEFQNLIEYLRIIPSNFGYKTNRTIGSSFAYLHNNEVYMTTTAVMKLVPYAVPLERRYRIKEFSDSDFVRLGYDPTANLIYSNKEFGVWSVNIP
jgi:hypothetical protein